jgi:hypothetical protein
VQGGLTGDGRGRKGAFQDAEVGESALAGSFVSRRSCGCGMEGWEMWVRWAERTTMKALHQGGLCLEGYHKSLEAAIVRQSRYQR